MKLFPALMLRTIGVAVRMNSSGKSHIMTNKGIGKPSLKFRRLTISMTMNGMTSRKLMMASHLRFVSMDGIRAPFFACHFLLLLRRG
jgi:hypothetical protein